MVEVALERYEEKRDNCPCRNDGEHGNPDCIKTTTLYPFKQQDGTGSAEIEGRDVEDVDGV
jgi:hypothetical protein